MQRVRVIKDKGSGLYSCSQLPPALGVFRQFLGQF